MTGCDSASICLKISYVNTTNYIYQLRKAFFISLKFYYLFISKLFHNSHPNGLWHTHEYKKGLISGGGKSCIIALGDVGHLQKCLLKWKVVFLLDIKHILVWKLTKRNWMRNAIFSFSSLIKMFEKNFFCLWVPVT